MGRQAAGALFSSASRSWPRDSNPHGAASRTRKFYHEVAPAYGTQKNLQILAGVERAAGAIEAPAGSRSGQRLPLRGQPFA